MLPEYGTSYGTVQYYEFEILTFIELVKPVLYTRLSTIVVLDYSMSTCSRTLKKIHSCTFFLY